MNNNDKNYNKIQKFLKIAAYAAPIIAILIAISYFLALRFDFDFSIGHFNRGSTLFYLAMASIGAGVIIPTVLAICTKGKVSITKQPETSQTALFCAVFAAIMSVFACITALPGILAYHPVSKLELGGAFGMIIVAFAAFCIISPKLGVSRVSQVLFSLSVVAVDLEILSNYFDQTMPLNSPVRHIVMLCEIALMLFFISEARLSFGTETTSEGVTSKRALFPFFVFANFTCASVTLGVSLGAVLFHFFGGVSAPTATHPSLFRLAAYIALSGIAIARLHSASKIVSPYVRSTAEGGSVPDEASVPEEEIASNENLEN